MSKAKLKKLREFSDGLPVDRQAVARYRDGKPPVDETLRMAASPDPKVQKTGRLRAAALVAALEESSNGDAEA